MTKISDSCTKTKKEKEAKLIANPLIMAALAKLDNPIFSVIPVGVSTSTNTTVISTESTLRIKHPSKSKAPEKKSKRSKIFISYHFRSLLHALAEIQALNSLASLSYITVNLSQAHSIDLLTSRRTPAKAYAYKLKRRFKAGLKTKRLHLKEQPNFFFILEESKDQSLHCHILMSHHPDDKALLNQMLRKEAADHKNAVQFKSEYKREHKLNQFHTNKIEFELSEIDREQDKTEGTDYFRYSEIIDDKPPSALLRLDSGVADYMSKEAGKPFTKSLEAYNREAASKGRKFYAQKNIVKRAKVIYEEAYREQQELDKKKAIQSKAFYEHRGSQIQAENLAMQEEDSNLGPAIGKRSF